MMENTLPIRESFATRLVARIERFTQMKYFTPILTAVAIISCVVTGVVMSAPAADSNAGYWLLNIDLILLLVLGAVIARHVVRVWAEREKGMAGSKLHVRLVSHFALLAAAPAILMAIFSAVFLYFGVHAWFNDRVSTAVLESQEVAKAYLKEHQQVMRADVLAMASVRLTAKYPNCRPTPPVSTNSWKRSRCCVTCRRRSSSAPTRHYRAVAPVVLAGTGAADGQATGAGEGWRCGADHR